MREAGLHFYDDTEGQDEDGPEQKLGQKASGTIEAGTERKLYVQSAHLELRADSWAGWSGSEARHNASLSLCAMQDIYSSAVNPISTVW